MGVFCLVFCKELLYLSFGIDRLLPMRGSKWKRKHFQVLCQSFTTSQSLHKRFIKGKTASSSIWLTRHIGDPYVRQAQIEGYRCRSAYKLLEIDQKHKLLKKGSIVIDCGAAPGAWSQVAAGKIMNIPVQSQSSFSMKSESDSFTPGLIIAIDLDRIDPIDGVTRLVGDFSSQKTQQNIHDILNGKTIDFIMSDMAPNASGVKALDQERIFELSQSVFNFAKNMLTLHGSLLCKLWQGPETKAFIKDLSGYFTAVTSMRPKATRKASSEIYIIAKDFVHKK